MQYPFTEEPCSIFGHRAYKPPASKEVSLQRADWTDSYICGPRSELSSPGSSSLTHPLFAHDSSRSHHYYPSLLQLFDSRLFSALLNHIATTLFHLSISTFLSPSTMPPRSSRKRSRSDSPPAHSQSGDRSQAKKQKQARNDTPESKLDEDEDHDAPLSAEFLDYTHALLMNTPRRTRANSIATTVASESSMTSVCLLVY